MSITFGLITDGNNEEMLYNSIKSILDARIDNSEIIVVGNSDLDISGVKVIKFDESEKIGWITRKKNLIAQHSTKKILVILHDYLSLADTWKDFDQRSFLNEEWDVAVCKITNLDGTRFRDLSLWPFNDRLLRLPFTYTLSCLLPYKNISVANLMYINGSTMIVRRDYFLKNPLDESRSWGQGEDVEWSIRLRDSWKLKFIPDIGFNCMKQKDVAFSEIRKLELVATKFYSVILKVIPTNFRSLLKIPY